MGTLVSEPSPVCPECRQPTPAEGYGGGRRGGAVGTGQTGREKQREGSMYKCEELRGFVKCRNWNGLLFPGPSSLLDCWLRNY